MLGVQLRQYTAPLFGLTCCGGVSTAGLSVVLRCVLLQEGDLIAGSDLDVIYREVYTPCLPLAYMDADPVHFTGYK